MQRKSVLFYYRYKIIIWIFVTLIISTAIIYGIDKKLIVFTAFIFGVFTEIFAGLGVIVAAIPLIGPMIIKIVSVPVFWILNALGTLVSGIAIKKGYATELARGRIMTLALLIGIVCCNFITRLLTTISFCI